MHSRLFVAVLLCVLVAISGCSGSTHRKGYTRVTKSSRVQKKAEIGYTFTGDASYYGKGFDGKKTASGEIFDRDDL